MNKWFSPPSKLKKAVVLSILALAMGFFVEAVKAAGPVMDGLKDKAKIDAMVNLQDPSAIRTQDDKTAQIMAEGASAQTKGNDISAWDALKREAGRLGDFNYKKFWDDVVVAGGSKALGSAISSALNQIALDTAEWLGSGGKGRKPMFYTEGWGTYLSNVADNAAGTFIEQLGKNNDYAKFNLCKPNFAVQMRIGLGLVQYSRPSKPACTFSEMTKNWEEELTKKDFMQRFQTMFNPTENDFGVALSLQTGISQQIKSDELDKILTRKDSKGWLNVNNQKIIDVGKLGAPGETERQLNLLGSAQSEGLTKYTGYALADAANVFINQLAISAFNNLMKKLGGASFTTPYANWDSLISKYTAGPAPVLGVSAAKEQLNRFIGPKFNVRGDYNILAELSSCPKPNRAGPTNCVIDEKFKQGILEKKTVGEAIKLGYLRGDSTFGFMTSNDAEPNYLEGYPYRSMLILRKFRIIPVGWEIAAQYIKVNPGVQEKTLKDLVDCFSDNARWCNNLVDPNWVLKSPLNYCRREGPGPENLSDDNAAMARNDKYCADEQSCIKEKNDGSCEYYGYCTEERRKWKFNTESCEPIYNTCQTFKQESGSTVSYLKNTLNYSGCSVDNAGCTDYCTAYNFGTGKYSCTATSTSDKVFLDRDAKSCDASSEGCSTFIRTKDGLGANLLLNSSFEDNLAVGGWAALGATSSDAYSGLNSLQLTPGVLTKNFIAGPGLTFPGGEYNVEGEAYSISLYSKDCPAGSSVSFKDGANTESVDITSGTTWQQFSLSHVFLSSGPDLDLEINTPAGSSCLIDSVKLEKGTKVTAYSEYSQDGLIHEKYAPSYLGCDGTGDPVECKNFARSCKFEEVGCELYTPANGDLPVPGKVQSGDYCVAECVGFDTYLQSQTTFDSLRPDYFIPKTAKTCSAELNGCDQFTNLDKLGSGAEATEYYSYLRQCVTSGGAQFYAWEGSDETGFQLKVVTLKPDNDGDDVALDLDGDPLTPNVADYAGDPAITGDRLLEVAKCNEKIYQLQQTDPGYNPDCREYYNAAGVKSYHLYSQTVSEDANCHPYRRTEVNIDPAITLAANCVGADKNWNAVTGECAVCLNGGEWNAQQGACIYQAIPGEGQQCSAAANGCREYTGNTGQSVKILTNSDFEEGTLQGWAQFNGAAAPTLSTESVNMGGHSLRIVTAGNNQGIVLKMPKVMVTGNSYAITLIAKTRTPVNLKARVTNAAAASVDFVGIGALSADWQMYRANLSELTITDPENLIVEADVPAEFFVDNVKLSEISNRFYLIKNSWNTPETCNQDMNKKPSALYMLGCNEYKDRDNMTHYLRSFSYLCGEGSVGCELMIDTHNSANTQAESFNTAAPAYDNVDVAADNYIYAVYDKQKQCQAEDAGCQRLGKPYSYQGERVYSDVYMKNNPNDYKTTMCSYDALSCDEYATETGASYFKNPGDAVCEWRPGPKNVFGWFKKKIKRCDGTGSACLEDKSCAAGQACKVETGDVACPTDATGIPKTLGFGDQRIAQPTNNATGYWAGLCPAEQSSCTELVDPVSGFGVNQLFNGDFADLDANPATIDGWAGAAPNITQNITLSGKTFYRLAAKGNAGTLALRGCSGNYYHFDPVSNNLTSWTNADIVINFDAQFSSAFFLTDGAITCTVEVSTNSAQVEVKKAVIDYQLSNDLDTNSCNGVVNQDEGCVLFNQRKNSSTTQPLLYDADLMAAVPTTAAAPDEADSNTLIKVTPDRACSKWLTCVSKVPYKDENGQEDFYCSDIGLCNQLDAKGNCSNVLYSKAGDQTAPLLGNSGLPPEYANADGYSKISYGGITAPDMRGQHLLSGMKQIGEYAEIPNGNFEVYTSELEPSSWKLFNGGTWSDSKYKIINNLVAAQTEGVRYPVENRSFLKVGAEHQVDSEMVTVSTGGAEYVLSARINTLNLSTGNAFLEVRNQAGAVLGSIVLPARSDWTLKVFNFTPGTSPVYFRLRTDTTVGNYYIDDIKLAPAIESRNNWLVTQSCRLFPATDSLACDYFDGSGVKYKGWKGYCLEYDRKPGNSDACLLWWPGERVKGDDIIDQQAGYQGETPLYYCVEAEALVPVKLMKKDVIVDNANPGDQRGTFTACAPAVQGVASTSYDCTYTLDWENDNDCGWFDSEKHNNVSTHCKPKTALIKDENVNEAWFEYDGVINDGVVTIALPTWNENDCGHFAACAPSRNVTMNVSEKGIKYYDPITDQLFDDKMAYCKVIAQTVTESGQTQFWSGRVFEGSKYQLPTLKYGYETPHRSFGAIMRPPSYNPPTWDGLAGNATVEPLYVSYYNSQTDYDSQVNGGRPYTLNANQVNGRPVNQWLGSCSISGEPCIIVNSGTPTVNTFKCDPVKDGVCGASFPIVNNAPQSATSLIKNIYAKSYGTWSWNNVTKRYDKSAQNWESPISICPIPNDPNRNDCAYVPWIDNVRVNNVPGNVTIQNNSFAGLTFNSHVDSQQLPLMMYEVIWEGESVTTVSGVQMADRPVASDPHSLSHLYSYWDLKNKDTRGVAGITCDALKCTVQPLIKIQDNWGWCNGDDPAAGRPKGTCSQYVALGGLITVLNQ